MLTRFRLLPLATFITAFALVGCGGDDAALAPEYDHSTPIEVDVGNPPSLELQVTKTR